MKEIKQTLEDKVSARYATNMETGMYSPDEAYELAMKDFGYTRQPPSDGPQVILGSDQLVNFRFMGYTAKELQEIVIARKSCTHPAKGLDNITNEDIDLLLSNLGLLHKKSPDDYKQVRKWLEKFSRPEVKELNREELLYQIGSNEELNARYHKCLTSDFICDIADIVMEFSRPEVPTVDSIGKILGTDCEINSASNERYSYNPKCNCSPCGHTRAKAQAIHDLLKIGVDK